MDKLDVKEWGQANTIRELLPVYTEIRDMMAADQFEDIDELLTVDVEELSPVLLVGLARLTFMRRDHLHEWQNYLSRAGHELDSRGLNDPSLLEGLAKL